MIGEVSKWATTETGGAKTTSTATITVLGVGRKAVPPEDIKVSGSGSSTLSISTLARQLADSATRAEERDRTLSYKELAAKATSIIDQIVGDSYFRNKAQHDSEIPNTDDPELLARAKQATAFVDSSIHQRHDVKNPFAGLSNEQLSLIAYDDSGPYTINERYAAYLESYAREEAWRQKVCGVQSLAEYENTGRHTNLFKECIEHFKGLPRIEQVQYPEDYVSSTTSRMNNEVDGRPYFANHGKGKDDKTLAELLFGPINAKVGLHFFPV